MPQSASAGRVFVGRLWKPPSALERGRLSTGGRARCASAWPTRGSARQTGSVPRRARPRR
eukprot:6871121-Alexandrium_andersonii.AAC.1